MEKKLTLELLAPYLPYGLKLLTEYKGSFSNDPNYTVIEDWDVKDFQRPFVNKRYMMVSCKPLLLPLSELTKKKFHFEYGEPCTLEEWINGNWDLRPLDWVLRDEAKEQREELILNLPYGVIVELIQYHFDVFGLLPSGVALNKLDYIKE